MVLSRFACGWQRSIVLKSQLDRILARRRLNALGGRVSFCAVLLTVATFQKQCGPLKGRASVPDLMALNAFGVWEALLAIAGELRPNSFAAQKNNPAPATANANKGRSVIVHITFAAAIPHNGACTAKASPQRG